MASTHNATKQSGDKYDLTQDQLDSLLKIAGKDGEEKIRKSWETLQQKYPEGYLTEKQFLEYMDSGSDSAYKSVSVPLAKRIFAATDRNNSGTIDFYEIMMSRILFEVNDPNARLRCLFLLGDSDHDGFLSQAETVDILTITMLLGGAFASQVAQEKEEVEKEKNSIEEAFKSLVNKTFGDKTQVSEEEFRQLFAERTIQFCDDAARFFSSASLGKLSRDDK